jgi:ABC-type phosphate/phosphonate transport system substrate-binding protein
MKRHAPFSWSVLAVIALAGLLLSACGGPPTPTLTPLPTLTPTPRSTPLPEVPTAVPLASEDNPLTLMMVPQGSQNVTSSAGDDLATLIGELTGLNVEVDLVDSYGEIVAQLCSANPVAGWLDGISYVVAEAQGCADPALQVERDGAPGFRVEMLMGAQYVGDELSPEDVGRLSGETLCRINSEDSVSWLMASLILQAAGINPLYDLNDIVDVDDYDAMIAAIYDDECQGGAVPFGHFENEIGSDLKALEDLAGVVAVVSESPVVPYDIFVYPQTVPLNVRIPLTDVLVQISANREQSAVLAGILASDGVERVDRSDFDDFREFMESTGYDFTVLGE